MASLKIIAVVKLDDIVESGKVLVSMHCSAMSYSPATIGIPRSWLTCNIFSPN